MRAAQRRARRQFWCGLSTLTFSGMALVFYGAFAYIHDYHAADVNAEAAMIALVLGTTTSLIIAVASAVAGIK